MFRITRRIVEGTGILIITLWDGDKWCSVTGFKKDKQTPEIIDRAIAQMKLRAQRPGAPRNGKRNAVKC